MVSALLVRLDVAGVCASLQKHKQTGVGKLRDPAGGKTRLRLDGGERPALRTAVGLRAVLDGRPRRGGGFFAALALSEAASSGATSGTTTLFNAAPLPFTR